jgi:hypothetical protein
VEDFSFRMGLWTGVVIVGEGRCREQSDEGSDMSNLHGGLLGVLMALQAIALENVVAG